MLFVVFVAVCAAASAQSVDELYRLARQEGEVSLYGGGPASVYTGWAKLFEEKYPGIKVRVTGGFSNRLAVDIDAQRKAGKLDADLAMLQTIQDFERWRREGALAVYRPEGFDHIPASFKDPDGAYVGIQVFALSYGFNTKAVDEGERPRSAQDFLHPRFAGKIISTYPHDDDVTLYLYDGIVRKYGWGFMEGLMKNRPQFVQGHLGVSQKVASGEFPVTFDTVLSFTLMEKRRGAPTDVQIPMDIPMPIWAQTAAVFREARHPNAARLYLAWYLSREQQHRMNRVGTWPTRADVEPPEGLKPLTEYNTANDFRAFMRDEQRIAELRKRFEQIIGHVGGPAYR